MNKKTDFFERLKKIFKEDFEALDLGFLLQNKRREILRKKISATSKSVNFCKLLVKQVNNKRRSSGLKVSNSFKKKVSFDTSFHSIIPINRKKTVYYMNNDLNKNNYSVKLMRKSKQNKYHKMLEIAAKNEGTEPFNKRIFQVKDVKGNIPNKFFFKKEPTQGQHKRDALILNPNTTKDLKNVKTKIKTMCQPLSVNKFNQTTLKFNGLKLVTDIKQMLHQSKTDNNQRVRKTQKNLVYFKQNRSINEKLYNKSKIHLANNIQNILKTPKGSTKKINFEMLKAFKKNFIKLAFFIKEFDIKGIDLFKLIPEKPYNDPDAREVNLHTLKS